MEKHKSNAVVSAKAIQNKINYYKEFGCDDGDDVIIALENLLRTDEDGNALDLSDPYWMGPFNPRY